MFKVGELTIRRLIKEGKLQAIRVGQQYRITPEAIEAFKRDNKS